MRDIRVMNFVSGQQIESNEVMRRLGQLQYRNLGSMAKIGLVNEGKAVITTGLRVTPPTGGGGMAIAITAGNILQRSTDVTGCIQKDQISVTLDAASGAPRIDMIECQISMTTSKVDYSRIGTVATGTETGSVIITNELINRDLRYYISARKKTNTTTATAATSAGLTGTVAIPGTIDLTDTYIVHISDGEDANWLEIDCRGATPNATSRAEIISAINTALGRTAASAGSGNVIVLTGSGTGEGSYFSFKPPVTNSDADGLEAIFGLSIGGLYQYEYRGTNSWIKLAEIDVGASTTSITEDLIRNIDQKNTWASETDEIIVKSPLFSLNEPDWNEWSDIRTYAEGEIAYLGDQQFVSLVGSNLNKDPLFETEWWMPCPNLNDILMLFHKGEPVRGGLQNIHNIRNAAYKQFFSIGKYRLGTRTLEAWGVHIDGTVVTGDTDLESIFRVGESDEYHLLDIIAPDSMGTRTLKDYRGRVPRVVTSTSGGSGDSEAVGSIQADQFQGFKINVLHDRAIRANNVGNLVVDLIPGTGSVSADFLPIDDGTNGTPRTGLETRMKNWAEGIPYVVVIKSV